MLTGAVNAAGGTVLSKTQEITPRHDAAARTSPWHSEVTVPATGSDTGCGNTEREQEGRVPLSCTRSVTLCPDAPNRARSGCYPRYPLVHLFPLCRSRTARMP